MWKTIAVGTYTNFNDFPVGTLIWANNSNNRFTNAPSKNAFHVLTLESITGYKLQIAVTFTGNTLYLRTSTDGTWNAWMSVSLGAVS